jgi:rod shape-determining protein MreD
VKLTYVLATIVIAVLLQVTLARYMVGGRWVFDFVLVGVVFAAVVWGSAAGMLAGTTGGLLQDVLSDGIVGVGGLAKTLVGFATGILGAQFVLARPPARALIVTGASVVHRLLILALYGLIDQRWPAISWNAMLAETLLNTLFGLIAFQVTAALPNVMERHRMNRRSSLSRRNW